MQLLGAFHSIGKSLDKGTETDIVYLDFAKAFDSVCHARLFGQTAIHWHNKSSLRLVPGLTLR